MSNEIREEFEKIVIPKELRERTKIGVQKAKAEQKRSLKNPLIAIAMIVALLFGTPFVSPTFANTLKSIPIIGSIIKMIGDEGLQKAEKLGYSQRMNETISVGDSSFMITDVIYDGSRLSLGFIVTNYQNENPFYHISFKFDELDFYGGANSQGEFINETDYVGIYNLIVPNELKRDSFNLSISIKEFNNKKGNWNINIPVSKIEDESFLVTRQTTSKDYKITMKKVTFTPATTEINFDLTEPINAEELNQIIQFRLYDDQGNELKEISAGGSGCHNCEISDGKITLDTSVQYEPIEDIPDYLILEPYISSTNRNIDELRMRIPLTKGEY